MSARCVRCVEGPNRLLLASPSSDWIRKAIGDFGISDQIDLLTQNSPPALTVRSLRTPNTRSKAGLSKWFLHTHSSQFHRADDETNGRKKMPTREQTNCQRGSIRRLKPPSGGVAHRGKRLPAGAVRRPHVTPGRNRGGDDRREEPARVLRRRAPG